jgi:hypothetical protein
MRVGRPRQQIRNPALSAVAKKPVPRSNNRADATIGRIKRMKP